MPDSASPPPPPPQPTIPSMQVEARPAIPPPNRQLPEVTGSKFDRIGYQLQHLFKDLREWLDLKVTLTQEQMQQEAAAKVKEVIAQAVPYIIGYGSTVFFGIYFFTFLLLTIGLVLGSILGSMWLGFGIVTLVLALVTGILGYKYVWPYVRASEEKKTQVEDISPHMAASARTGAHVSSNLDGQQD